MLSKTVSLGLDLVTSTETARNGQRTEQYNQGPDFLGRQYSLVSKAEDFCFFVSCCSTIKLSTGLLGAVPTYGLTAEQLRSRKSWRKTKGLCIDRAYLALHKWINESTGTGMYNPC